MLLTIGSGFEYQDSTKKILEDKLGMDTTTAAASVAAISGLAAYLNGKYHIAQDLRALRFKKAAAKHYAELGMLLIPFTFGYSANPSMYKHLQVR